MLNFRTICISSDHQSARPAARGGEELSREPATQLSSVTSGKLSGILAAMLSLATLSLVMGCSASSTKPQVGAISFTDASGNIVTSSTTLALGTGAYVEAALANDKAGLGVNWSVSCGSQPAPGTPLPPGVPIDPTCGTFSMVHTISGPVPSFASSAAGYVTYYTAPTAMVKNNTVTLYASAVGDPSHYTSVTLGLTLLPVIITMPTPPPASLAVNGTAMMKAVIANDFGPGGVNWAVTCGSTACGSIAPVQTASGATATYTAPSVVPTPNTVKITAASVADATKTVSSTVTILPLTVTVSPNVTSVATAGNATLTATVTNDVTTAGVDWTATCTNTMTPGSCGTFSPAHTATGVATTYTAPNLATIGINVPVTAKATSTADKKTSATSTLTTYKGLLVGGGVTANLKPVNGASVALYAATSSDAPMVNALAGLSDQTPTATTDSEGRFAIPAGYVCPTLSTQMYLVSVGGNAGGGTNPNLALMAALGPCGSLDGTSVTVNETTTVASIYALSNFTADGVHVGSSSTSSAALTSAFTTANNLVDMSIGAARTNTPAGAGLVPAATINTIASMVSACAATAGSARGDGGACDRYFAATNLGATPASAPANTLQATLNLAHDAGVSSSAALFELAASAAHSQPVLSQAPADWTLGVTFTTTPGGLGFNNKNVATDGSGNVWVRGASNSFTEFVGASSLPATHWLASPAKPE